MTSTIHFNEQGYKLAKVKKGVRPWGGRKVTIVNEITYPNGRIELTVVLGNVLINDGTTEGKGLNFWSADKERLFAPNELDFG